MKLLKNLAVAATVALSLGTFSTTASAVCLGMACMYNNMTPLDAIKATEAQVAKTLKSVNDNAGHDVILKDIQDALKVSKEINANDKVDSNRNRANAYLKKARTAVKDNDLNKAAEDLKEAESRFAALKGMIELTQADRASQQKR